VKTNRLKIAFSITNGLEVLERLGDVGLDDLAGRLGLEDTGLLGEGVDALASLGGGLLLDDEASHAWDDELAALGELTLSNGGESLEAGLAFLLGELSLEAEVVQKLGLGEVGTLGLHRGGDEGLGLGSLDGLLGGDLLADLLLGGLLLGGLAGDTLAATSDALLSSFGSHVGNRG